MTLLLLNNFKMTWEDHIWLDYTQNLRGSRDTTTLQTTAYSGKCMDGILEILSPSMCIFIFFIIIREESILFQVLTNINMPKALMQRIQDIILKAKKTRTVLRICLPHFPFFVSEYQISSVIICLNYYYKLNYWIYHSRVEW